DPRCGRRDHRGGRGEPHAPAGLHDEDRHRVRADRHERHVAEGEEARVAELELRPEREDRVDPGDDADERPKLRAREDAPTRRALPRIPCGRATSTTMSTANATTGL